MDSCTKESSPGPTGAIAHRHYADGYSEAIPADDLTVLGHDRTASSAATSRARVDCDIRSRLCPCIQGEEYIVATIVQEYSGKQRKSSASEDS